MLRKLLKYDFKSVWRIWWIVAASVLGLSFAGSFALRLFIIGLEDERFVLVSILAFLFLMVSFFAVFASILITEILVFWRFYKHFFTDEGYLTFTLPVKRKDLLLSKTLNALIWTGLHLVLLVVCAMIFMLFAPPATDGGSFINLIAFQTVGGWFTSLAEIVGGGWLAVYLVEGLLIFVGLLLFSTSLIHFCITLGSIIAKKAKLLAAIGVYYVVNMVSSFVMQLIFSLFFGVMGERFGLLLEAATRSEQHIAIMLLLLIFGTMVATVASIMYFLTLGNLERKLNLT